MTTFAGAAMEVSQSGEGIHIFGSGEIPPHSCKNRDYGIEFYHEGRFVLLTDTQSSGDCDIDFTEQLKWLVEHYFPLGDISDVNWRNTPVPEYGGPETKAEIIAKAMEPTAAQAAFGNNV